MMTKVIPIPKGDFDKLIEETSVYELKSFLKVIRDSYLKAISSVRLEDVMGLFDGYTMKNQPDGNKLYTFQLARYSNARGEYRLNFTVTHLTDRNVINFGELFTTYMKKTIQPKFENVFSETKHFAVIEDLAARITTEHKRHVRAMQAAAKRKTYGEYGDI